VSRACFGILGPLAVEVSDSPVEITAMQLRRLLCILLLAPGRPVPTSTIVECMWPSEAPESSMRPHDPAKTLRIYASRLRRRLPEATGPRWDVRGYRLEIDVDDLDAKRFERLLTDAASIVEEDPARCAAILRAVLALWRGPAFFDCRDEEWALSAAIRLDELRLTAVERMIDARLACGEDASLCAELEQLVEDHPLRERFWAQLMLALYRAGRQADALRTYQQLRTLLREEIGIEPGRELAELEAAVLRQDPAIDGPPRRRVDARPASRDAARRGESVPSRRAQTEVDGDESSSNLPLLLTSFVGRSRELTAVHDLASTSRLVTLVGPGGVGKTRLAIKSAEELRETADGAFLVELAPLRRPDEIARAIAFAIGVRVPAGSDALQRVIDAVHDQSLLIVLDNCEHLVEASAVVCRRLMGSCAGVRVLATSRQPLGIAGEVLYPVPVLGVPPRGADAVAEIVEQDAVRLFDERARAEQAGFRVDDANAALVASICRRLDGIPLALELAASRLQALSLAEIHAGLEERFRLLAVGGRSDDPRHRTLEALIDWSYELLDDDERRTLGALAVFVGGFDLESAYAVVGEPGKGVDDEAQRWEVLEHVSALVRKSLVAADTSAETTRYTLLETIRQYALTKVAEAHGRGALESLRQAHDALYVEMARRAAPLMWTGEQSRWLWRLELEFDNIRAALHHLLQSQESARVAMKLMLDLERFFDWSGREGELFALLEQHAEAWEGDPADPLSLRFEILRSKYLGRVDPAGALRAVRRIVEAARALGDERIVVEAQARIAWLASFSGDDQEAALAHGSALAAARAYGEQVLLARVLITPPESTEESLELLRMHERSGDAISLYLVLHNLGETALEEGDLAGARSYLGQATEMYRVIRGPGEHAALHANIATLMLAEGSNAEARAAFRRTVEIANRQLYTRYLCNALLGLALCASRDGDRVLSATLYGAASYECERAGFPPGRWLARAWEDEGQQVATTLGPRRYEAALGWGRRLSRGDVVATALGRQGPFVAARRE
jgi:predicted ATPase/DNA-binding SARP family transcriptional activator